MRVPSVAEIGELLAPLDDRDRKVAGGLTALLMAEPAGIRDPEWQARAFLQVAVVAFGFDGQQGQASSDDVALVQRYAQGRLRPLWNVAVALLVRVAEDLRDRCRPSLDDARVVVAEYLAGRRTSAL